MSVIFVSSNEYTPVDLTNLEEIAARIFWCEQTYRHGAHPEDITGAWNHPNDRDGAIRELRLMEESKERAKEYLRTEGA